MSDINPFDQVYRIALYKQIKYGWNAVFEVSFDEDKETPHEDYVRIGEIIDVRFKKADSDTVIQNALAAIDKAEHEARMDLERKLATFREQRANFLALAHQPQEQTR